MEDADSEDADADGTAMKDAEDPLDPTIAKEDVDAPLEGRFVDETLPNTSSTGAATKVGSTDCCPEEYV